MMYFKTPSSNGTLGDLIHRPHAHRPFRKSRREARARSDGELASCRGGESGVSVDRKLPLRRRPVKREATLAALIRNKVTVVIWNSVNRRLHQLGQLPVSQKTVQRALQDFPKSRR
jgi:hypothetical protein